MTLMFGVVFWGTPHDPQVKILKSETERLCVCWSSIIVSSYMEIRCELMKGPIFDVILVTPGPPRGRIAKILPDHCSTVHSKGIDTSHDSGR